MTAEIEREMLVCLAHWGRCDLVPIAYGWIGHRCTNDDGHDGAHECGCGERWSGDDG